MAVKEMSKDQELSGCGTYRGALEVVNDYAVRFVFAGVPTVYIYGICCGELEHSVEVCEVEDQETRERVRASVALWKDIAVEDVVWARF